MSKDLKIVRYYNDSANVSHNKSTIIGHFTLDEAEHYLSEKFKDEIGKPSVVAIGYSVIITSGTITTKYIVENKD